MFLKGNCFHHMSDKIECAFSDSCWPKASLTVAQKVEMRTVASPTFFVVNCATNMNCSEWWLCKLASYGGDFCQTIVIARYIPFYFWLFGQNALVFTVKLLTAILKVEHSVDCAINEKFTDKLERINNSLFIILFIVEIDWRIYKV